MRHQDKPARSMPCPCGGGALAECCGRFIDNGQIPKTALKLMRSRYAAYVLGNEHYLQATWYGSTRPNGRLLSDESVKWLSLDIRRHEAHGSDATVEFIARYKVQGKAHKLHEISRFIHEDGRWFYLDGSFPANKPGSINKN